MEKERNREREKKESSLRGGTTWQSHEFCIFTRLPRRLRFAVTSRNDDPFICNTTKVSYILNARLRVKDKLFVQVNSTLII